MNHLSFIVEPIYSQSPLLIVSALQFLTLGTVWYRCQRSSIISLLVTEMHTHRRLPYITTSYAGLFVPIFDVLDKPIILAAFFGTVFFSICQTFGDFHCRLFSSIARTSLSYYHIIEWYLLLAFADFMTRCIWVYIDSITIYTGLINVLFRINIPTDFYSELPQRYSVSLLCDLFWRCLIFHCRLIVLTFNGHFHVIALKYLCPLRSLLMALLLL